MHAHDRIVRSKCQHRIGDSPRGLGRCGTDRDAPGICVVAEKLRSMSDKLDNWKGRHNDWISQNFANRFFANAMSRVLSEFRVATHNRI